MDLLAPLPDYQSSAPSFRHRSDFPSHNTQTLKIHQCLLEGGRAVLVLFEGLIPPSTAYSDGCLRWEPREAPICIRHSWCQWLVLGIGAPSDPRGALQGISCGPAAVTHWITRCGLHKCWCPYQEYSALPVIKGEEGTDLFFGLNKGRRERTLAACKVVKEE